MKVLFNPISTNYSKKTDVQKIKSTSSVFVSKNNLEKHNEILATLNKQSLSFKGYCGDIQPVKKLFYIVSGKNSVFEDAWTHSHLYQVGLKKWVNAHPIELLKRTPEQAIQSICTLVKPNNQFPGIPPFIPTPNFGDKWGRHANYIEINPRTIAKYENGRITDGLLQTMKLLPALPTSPNCFANCVILSQLYPSFWGDGTTQSDSLYTANLHSGISNNLTSEGLYAKMGADEQVKAFNDLAHMLGLKTGFRMLLSSGQLKVQGENFDWHKHEKAFIDACVWGVDLGFDAIYFDSAKHIIDRNGYMGVGNLPNKDQMAYILYQIRNITGRNDIAFIGEKSDNRQEFKEMGFTAGTDWGKADNFESVKWEAQNQAYSREYAAGPEVSNDNDNGSTNYETRLNRINSCLFGFDHVGNKLPSYMQLHDIMPLAHHVNTHDLMIRPIQTNGSNAWSECERHWDGIFAGTPEANNHRQRAYNIFENFIKSHG